MVRGRISSPQPTLSTVVTGFAARFMYARKQQHPSCDNVYHRSRSWVSRLVTDRPQKTVIYVVGVNIVTGNLACIVDAHGHGALHRRGPRFRVREEQEMPVLQAYVSVKCTIGIRVGSCEITVTIDPVHKYLRIHSCRESDLRK